MNTITRRALGALTIASLMALTACANLTGDRPAANVAQRIAQTPELSTFATLLEQSGLKASLEGPTPVTVFAPTNDAFKALPAATLEKLTKNPDALKAALTFHVVPGLIKSSAIDGATTLTTQNGAKLNVAKAGSYLTVEEALATQTDLPAGNGLVQVIDGVLLPPAPKK
ncbi:MAG: hypothetical protein RI907_3573 [Pseudomonadota bacterium]|jgi:uncharacterized surface protein with fasciclin (FAS1) repeats